MINAYKVNLNIFFSGPFFVVGMFTNLFLNIFCISFTQIKCIRHVEEMW